MKRKTKLGQSAAVSYQMMGLWLVMFVVFMLIPVIIAVIFSFTSFDMLNMPKFNGVENYVRLFLDDDVFTISLKNTLIIAVITGPATYLLSFVFAWCINELGRGWRSFLTLCFYAPTLSGNAYFIWQLIFSGDSFGIINSLLLDYGFIDSPDRKSVV